MGSITGRNSFVPIRRPTAAMLLNNVPEKLLPIYSIVYIKAGYQSTEVNRNIVSKENEE